VKARALAKPAVRCAIYTRKSSEEGLDQSFNSLHAQREACEAYVKSQANEGWMALPTLYDDGGFSGGNLDRPAMQALLRDVEAGRIDTVVVYKIDRLTRALADFAKIVEIFDARGVSFVSVTQAFNTTTSMGRLTLNVLLSFAQFEREVTGERIRDKIAASKRKGMWMGGSPPLGYDPPIDPITRALVVNPDEAERVRLIYASYLKLGSVSALEAYLAREGVRSKAWTSRSGRSVGGCRINRGALFHLLKNRTYIGEIVHGDASYPAPHPPIIDRAIFDEVQVHLAEQRQSRRERPTRIATAPLRGLIFDADGQPMSPVFSYGRGGRTYRYYVTTQLQQGRQVSGAEEAIRRVSADEIETLVRDQVAPLTGDALDAPMAQVAAAVARVEVEPARLRITLRRKAITRAAGHDLEPCIDSADLGVLIVPIRCKLRGGRTWIVPPQGSRAIFRPRLDTTLIKRLREAHRVAAEMGWRMADGGVDDLAAKAPPSPYHRKLVRLAFLAPDLQQAIIDGSQPVGLSLKQLLNEPIPIAWDAQRRLYGAV